MSALTFNALDMSVRLSFPRRERKRRIGLRLPPAALVLAVDMEQPRDIPSAVLSSSKGAEYVQLAWESRLARGTNARRK